MTDRDNSSNDKKTGKRQTPKDLRVTGTFAGWSGYSDGFVVTGNDTYEASFDKIAKGSDDTNGSDSDDTIIYLTIVAGVVAAITVVGMFVFMIRKP